MRFNGRMFLLGYLVLSVFDSTGKAQRFSNNDRQAVVLEAYYALRKSHDGGCDLKIGGNCAGGWNFLADTTGPAPEAYQTVKEWYDETLKNQSHTCLASDWAIPAIDDCPNDTPLANPPSFYSDAADYGFSEAEGLYGSVGRGGQCRFFANLLVYRALSPPPPSRFPSYLNMWNDVETNLTKALPGDVLTTKPGNKLMHTAIVVSITIDATGDAILALVDSNWLSDTGALNREVIGMHTIRASAFRGIFGLWKGISYYDTPWIPLDATSLTLKAPSSLKVSVQ